MASSPRSQDSPPQLDEGRRRWRPDQSGTRQRLAHGADDTIEELEASELELLDAPRPSTRPPRPPSIPPAPPLSSLTRTDRVDLDALVFDAGRVPMPVLPTMPVIIRPRSRPSWGAALALAVSAMVVGASAAIVLLVTRDASLVTGRAGDAVAKLDVTQAIGAIPSSRAIALAPVPRAYADSAPDAPVPEPQLEEPDPVSRWQRITQTLAGRNARRRARLEARAAPHEPTHAATETTSPPSRSSPRAARAVAPRVEPAGDRPEQPGRADVEGAVANVLPSVRECAPGLGVVQLELHFAPSGRTTVAQIDSSRATPAQRSCMARAARAARVPPFSGAHLTVRYPARL